MNIVKVSPILPILGIEHKVYFRGRLAINADAAGQSNNISLAIEIANDAAPAQNGETFLHEIMHRLEFALGWTLREKESQPLRHDDLHALSRALWSVLVELGIEFDFSELPTRD